MGLVCFNVDISNSVGYILDNQNIKIKLKQLKNIIVICPTCVKENWKIEYTPDGGETVSVLIDKGETSYLIENLETGVNYTVKLQFVGYDELLSTGLTDTATPT